MQDHDEQPEAHGAKNSPSHAASGRKSSRLIRGRFEEKAFLIPASITVIGIFCGFLAIVAAFRGEFEYACKCIGVAFVLDGLDGRVARRLNATSAFGREFDSLSDVIAFGVAPAVLVYCWGFRLVADEFGLLIAYVFVVCGATRLARFNVATSSEASKHFEGLPIPGAAAAIISLVYLFPVALENTFAVSAMIFYTVLLAYLMVSHLEFFSLKHVKLTQGNPRLNLVGLAFIVALVWYHNRIALVFLSMVYALSGPVRDYLRKQHPEALRKVRKYGV